MTLEYTLLLTIAILMLVCGSLIVQLVRAEKKSKEWRRLYFETRSEAQDLFDENLELWERSNKSSGFTYNNV